MHAYPASISPIIRYNSLCVAVYIYILEGFYVMEGKSSGIRVVEHENRRDASVSFFPKEVRQICKDISCFFDPELDLSMTTATDRGRKGVVSSPESKVDIGAELPEALEMLVQNPKIWFYEFKVLERVEVAVDGLLAFAENVEEERLCCGQDVHDGGVFEVDSEGQLERIDDNLGNYLEKYRDALLSNQLEFIEDVGMVEKTTSTHK